MKGKSRWERWVGEVLKQLPGTKSLPRSAGPDSCWQGWGEGSFVVPGLVGRQSFGLPAARHAAEDLRGPIDGSRRAL